MIIKSFELNKLKLKNHKFYLFYGDNEGLKEETIKNLFEKNYQGKIHRYEEKEVLDNKEKIQIFSERVKSLDLRDVRANVLFSRRIERLRDNGDENLFIHLSRIILAQRPSNHETWNELGKLHERRGEYDDAWFCYDQAQTYFPTLPVRDRYKLRMEAKMDGGDIIPWKEPIVKNRVDFLKKMENMATPRNYVENLEELKSKGTNKPKILSSKENSFLRKILHTFMMNPL